MGVKVMKFWGSLKKLQRAFNCRAKKRYLFCLLDAMLSREGKATSAPYKLVIGN